MFLSFIKQLQNSNKKHKGVFSNLETINLSQSKITSECNNQVGTLCSEISLSPLRLNLGFRQIVSS